MRPQHDPLATADNCPACVTDPDGFDHEAVLRMRPADFEKRVLAAIRKGQKDGHIAGVQLGPFSPGMARGYLVEIGAEPRPAKRGRAA